MALSGPFGSRQRPEMRKTAATGSSPFWDGRRFLPLNFRIDSPSHWGIRELAAMLKKLLAVWAGLLFALTVYAATVQTVEWAEQHSDRYIVRKGDTLWDISAHFLKKPWLWPEIWQDNPQVQQSAPDLSGRRARAFQRARHARSGLDRAACARHLARRFGQADSAVRAEAVPQGSARHRRGRVQARAARRRPRGKPAARHAGPARLRARPRGASGRQVRDRPHGRPLLRHAAARRRSAARGLSPDQRLVRRPPGSALVAWSGGILDGRQRALPRL